MAKQNRDNYLNQLSCLLQLRDSERVAIVAE